MIVQLNSKDKLTHQADFFSSDGGDRNVPKSDNRNSNPSASSKTKEMFSAGKVKRDSDILSNLKEPALPSTENNSVV
jgi:hypothetical protein